MSTVIILFILHIAVMVTSFVICSEDKEWFRTTSFKERILIYAIITTPVINLVLLALMLSGRFMTKALFGSSKKD